MIELLIPGVLSVLTANNTPAVLQLLQEGQVAFNHPIEGAALHAEMLYSCIKNANQEVLKSLLNLKVLSDIVFFKFCGHTPISLALENGNIDLLPLLLTKTDKNFALHMAVKLKQEKTLKYLLTTCIFKERLLKFLGLHKR
jgi:hypothetical protein